MESENQSYFILLLGNIYDGGVVTKIKTLNYQHKIHSLAYSPKNFKK